MTPTFHTLTNLLNPWRTICRLEEENKRLKEQAVLRAQFNWEAKRLVDLKYEQLATAREALRRALHWGGLDDSRGYNSEVGFSLAHWIEGGMSGPLPPLPEYLARWEQADAGEGL